MNALFRLLITSWLALILCDGVSATADDSKQLGKPPTDQATVGAAAGESADPADQIQWNDEVRTVLTPLFSAIKNAKVSRATVAVISDSLMTGRIVESKRASYQIASKAPNQFTIYFKEPSERTRIYNNGESLVVALAPDAFFRLSDPITNEQALLELPVPMGPYPEPILALTLAGVDPTLSLVAGMKSIEIVDRENFRGRIPALHLRGVQADEVSWDLWLTKDDPPRPLRLLVDLTPMLLSSPELGLPKGYSQQIRFDFDSWRVSGLVDDSLFSFTPAADAIEYQSLQHYTDSVAAANARHPMLGMDVPEFNAEMLDGAGIKTKDWTDRVVVLDFWTSWHQPSAVILPLLKEVTDEFADQAVTLMTLNIREDKQQIQTFLDKQELEIPVIIDGDGAVTKQFRVETIPQTMVIGKNGKIESIHLGFPGQKELQQRLRDELEVLSVGGQIATAAKDPAEANSGGVRQGDP